MRFELFTVEIERHAHIRRLTVKVNLLPADKNKRSLNGL